MCSSWTGELGDASPHEQEAQEQETFNETSQEKNVPSLSTQPTNESASTDSHLCHDSNISKLNEAVEELEDNDDTSSDRLNLEDNSSLTTNIISNVIVGNDKSTLKNKIDYVDNILANIYTNEKPTTKKWRDTMSVLPQLKKQNIKESKPTQTYNISNDDQRKLRRVHSSKNIETIARTSPIRKADSLRDLEEEKEIAFAYWDKPSSAISRTINLPTLERSALTTPNFDQFDQVPATNDELLRIVRIDRNNGARDIRSPTLSTIHSEGSNVLCLRPDINRNYKFSIEDNEKRKSRDERLLFSYIIITCHSYFIKVN